MLRKLFKDIAALSPFPLSKNEYYDRLTERIIRKVCNKNSVCVDVGANDGKILNMFIKHCPDAIHFAFEPIPELYFFLVRRYGSAAKISKSALTNKKGTSEFYYVLDDPAYSSLRYQNFKGLKRVQQTVVDTDLLDNFLPQNIRVKIIKLDIEGGEYDALSGARDLIMRCEPYILFEFGKRSATVFNVSPAMIYDYLHSLNYKIQLLPTFLKSGLALAFSDFQREYEIGTEYFFIGSPMLAHN